MAWATDSFLKIPPSLPSFALQSFTPLPLPPPNAAANISTITPQNWQVSFYLRNTNTFSLSCPAKESAVFYDHIDARLLLQDADSFTISHNASTPFDQPAGQGSVVQLSFPGKGTAAAMGRCTAEEAAYSWIFPCRAMTFSMEWNARVRFGGTTRHSRKLGSVNVVCKDVKVFVSSDTTVTRNDSNECFVRGTWSTLRHVALMAWMYLALISFLLLSCLMTCCACCALIHENRSR